MRRLIGFATNNATFSGCCAANIFGVISANARIPVYKDSIEEVVGIIYARDLLHIWHNKGLIIIPDLVQPAYFVPPNKKVNDVLKDFQRMKIQIAIVVDENKKTLGLVTLEDLIEEIVGEIEEAYK
ncbi:MAG: CBS domain-containing protein [Candidatus Omnitrophica bacterium]|nr:CBS domain-containing protein [Candidatus Omnitrophota bacterium]